MGAALPAGGTLTNQRGARITHARFTGNGMGRNAPFAQKSDTGSSEEGSFFVGMARVKQELRICELDKRLEVYEEL